MKNSEVSFAVMCNILSVQRGGNMRLFYRVKIVFLPLIFIVLFSSLCSSYTIDSLGVPMRDSTMLGTDLYYPETSSSPWSVLIHRTPYSRTWPVPFIAFVTDSLGMVLMVQNLRGWGDSEGEKMPFFSDAWGEYQDGYDAIEWAAGQSWSNGKTGMYGFSADGFVQYLAAGAAPPHLTCCAPMATAQSFYHEYAFVGGEFRKALMETWNNNHGTPWLIDTTCNHPNYDSAMAIVNLEERYDLAEFPMFHITGWYDLGTDGHLKAFSELQKRYHNQKLFIGPWGHSTWGSNVQGDIIYPPNAYMSTMEFLQMVFEWDYYWLVDSTGISLEPKVTFYLMGDCDIQDTIYWNHWVEADTWPLPDIIDKAYYLREGGLLDSIPPSGTSAIDSFQYDPTDPCTTYGGREYIGLVNGYGPINQNPIESRHDVLVYTTPVLTSPLTVVGKLRFVLYAASNCYDTDWTVRVSDVYPDGRSILLTDGILMARHRHGFDREDSLIPGVVDTFTIDLWSTANVFNTGHRIRVLLSSSNYPRFEKNPNTGAPFQRDDTTMVIASQKIYRSTSYPSYLILPVSQSLSLSEKGKKKRYRSPYLSIQTISSHPQIRLSLKNPVNVGIELYDISGRSVWSLSQERKGRGDYTVVLPELPQGVYFIRSQIGGVDDVRKIVVIR
jgi:predicted acyl esterase